MEKNFVREKFGELKSICIGIPQNIMEILKIGKKTWWNGVIHQICQSFFTTMFLLYGGYVNSLNVE